ncbi:MAG: 2-hydroxyacyl-CoA dehydratase [Candidatus Schekmanbacteria bacterium]|nr:2-hydroxyacyl-CoA dehydratase [Candidatus Schekmanbacteria bacterium]
MITAGIDIGSRSSKVVILEGRKVLATALFQSSMKVADRGRIVFDQALEKAGLREKEIDYIVATGYGRVNAPFARKTVTEITCHARGIHTLCPSVRTVIDIGGQDSKVIKLNAAGEVVDFAMNDRCAAGTGKFLEVTSKAMDLDLDLFARLYFDSKNPCKISSMCTVFAESEVVSLVADGNSMEDIVAGLILAVCRRVGNMAKKLKVEADVAFTGGVAKNAGVRAGLSQEIERDFIKFDFDPQLNGAYGAAVIAQEQVSVDVACGGAVKKNLNCLEKLSELLRERPKQLAAQKAAGQKIVGHFCAYIPEEIIYAAGLIPLRLNQGGNVEVSTAGNSYLSSSSCPFTCSCIGLKESKQDFYYEAVDYVADAPSCLQMKRMLEVWEKYFGVKIIHVGFSRKYYTPEGREFYRQGLEQLVCELEGIVKRPISAADLAEAIKLFNDIRSCQRKLYQALKSAKISWSDLIQFIRAGSVLDKRDYLLLLQALLNETDQHPANQVPAIRILLAGGMMASGDDKLINIFRDLGMEFAMDELCSGSRGIYIEVKEPNLDNLAAAYINNVPCGSLPYHDEQSDPRNKHIKRLIAEYKINGVLYYTLRFCDAYSFKLQALKQLLDTTGIPVLHLHSDYSDSDVGQLKTRVEAFRESLVRNGIR